MFYRVVVNVVDVILEVLIITNDVILKALLPKLHPPINSKHIFVRMGEVRFCRLHDRAETAGAIRPDQQVHVIGQEHISEHDKRVQFLRVAQRFEEQVQGWFVSKHRLAPLDDIGNENDGVGYVIASEVHRVYLLHHAGSRHAAGDDLRGGCCVEARLVVTPEAMTYEGDRWLVIHADVTPEAMTYEGVVVWRHVWLSRRRR